MTNEEVASISSPTTSRRISSAYAEPNLRVRDCKYLIGVWALVAVFAMVTIVRSYQVGIPIRDPHGTIFALRVLLTLAWFIFLIFIDASIRIGRHAWTLKKATTEVRRRWSKPRLALALSGFLAYHIVYLSYHNLKSWNAFNQIQDDKLLRLDRWLFFGHSPAVLLHDALGQHAATYVLAIVYESFSYMVPLSFVAAMVFAHRIRDGYVFLTATLWIWILGTLSYYILPTLGPFASAPKEFAGLPHTWITNSQTSYMAHRNNFLQHPMADNAANSVNAFASLHIGFTAVALFTIAYYGFKRATRVMVIYLIAVMISTIYLGWHFVADDVAGLLLAYIAVCLARLMIYPHGRPIPGRDTRS